MIVLEGAAGAGKTTVAQVLARRLGVEYVAVEAVHCWPVGDVGLRQKCFLDTFKSIVLEHGEGVADNGLLTVYAYSVVLGAGYSIRQEAWQAAMEEARRHRVAVLTADYSELAKRISERMGAEPVRRVNVVESDLTTHARVQEVLEVLATAMGVPIVDTSGKSPEEAAEAVLEALDLAG